MNWNDYIISDKKVLLGKPIIKGTRITVEHILSLFAQGWTEQQILDNYPRLKIESLNAIFAYLHDCFKDGLLYNNSLKSA